MYSVLLTAGQTYVITTTTTPGGALNDVDSAAELREATDAMLAAAANGAPDRRNVWLPFTPSVTREYRVRLYAESGHSEYVLHITPAAAGDTDLDGDVDLDDLNAVRSHFGEQGYGLPGDTAPFDGKVNLGDLNAARNNFGFAGAPSTAATLYVSAASPNRPAAVDTCFRLICAPCLNPTWKRPVTKRQAAADA